MKKSTAKLVFEASELADFCATDVATIYTWVKKGEIPYFKTPGGRLRFKREAIIDFLRKYHFPIPIEIAEGRPKIALIDEENVTLQQTRKFLSRSFDVDAHDEVYKALLSIGEAKPDGIVLDVRNQSNDGLRLIQRLHDWEPLKHTRIIVFSNADDLQRACLDAGASAFVSKPNSEELHTRLRTILTPR